MRPRLFAAENNYADASDLDDADELQ